MFLRFDQPDAVSSAIALSRAPPGTSVSERLGTASIKEKRRIMPANQLKLAVSIQLYPTRLLKQKCSLSQGQLKL